MDKYRMIEKAAYFFSSQFRCRTCPIYKFCDSKEDLGCEYVWEDYITMDGDLLAIVMSDLVLDCLVCPLLCQCDGDCFDTWKQWVDQMID